MKERPAGLRGNCGPVKLRLVSVFLAPLLFSFPALACKEMKADCIYSNGRFAPFEVRFSTDTSAGGLKIDVDISQRLEKERFDDAWNFRTKISGFAYGLYGSVIDSSDFTILPDRSYRTHKFSRKAKAYGVIPIIPTSFRQKFEWNGDDKGHVRSKYKGDWHDYDIDGEVLDQAILPLQMRMDLMKSGPDLGTRVYTATSKKHVDNDFMVRFVQQQDLNTPLGKVPTVVYELLKGKHKDNMRAVTPGHDLASIELLLDRLISLQKMSSSKQQKAELQRTGEELNALLKVDSSTIVSISEDDAKSSGKKDDNSMISKASEIEEGNARVFFWMSSEHAYLPVKMLAVIDSNAWSKVMIKSVEIDDIEWPYL